MRRTPVGTVAGHATTGGRRPEGEPPDEGPTQAEKPCLGAPTATFAGKMDGEAQPLLWFP